MKQGIPLNDEDRYPWLAAINSKACQLLTENHSGVFACSALKFKYREILSRNIENAVQWVLLSGSFSLIEERMSKRVGHFMPKSLLTS